MLLNLEGLRKTYDQFVDWTFSDANIQRGLHFGDFGPGDQGAYAELGDNIQEGHYMERSWAMLLSLTAGLTT